MASEYADNLDSRKLKEQSEKRSTEALKLKDDQIMMLMSQNNKHLGDIQELEEKLSLINEGKITVENANRELSQVNFDLQAKARAAETQSKRMTAEVQDKEKQLRIMTDQNSELLRLLESEESLAARLQSEVAQLRNEIDEVTQKYTALSSTARTHEELATKAAKEGQLRAEEIRLLRAECEQLKQQNAELKMKTQVEVEALQEQLRVRKEKQYQLLEKLQAQEEAKRQAEAMWSLRRSARWRRGRCTMLKKPTASCRHRTQISTEQTRSFSRRSRRARRSVCAWKRRRATLLSVCVRWPKRFSSFWNV